MKDSGYYTKAQISQALSRIEEYSEMNREHPGYFDSTIVCGMFYMDFIYNCRGENCTMLGNAMPDISTDS